MQREHDHTPLYEALKPLALAISRALNAEIDKANLRAASKRDKNTIDATLKMAKALKPGVELNSVKLLVKRWGQIDRIIGALIKAIIENPNADAEFLEKTLLNARKQQQKAENRQQQRGKTGERAFAERGSHTPGFGSRH